MGYANLERVVKELEGAGLDGLLVLSPENFAYFAGTAGFPVTMWRRAGPASALVSASGKVAFVVPETIAAAVQAANPDATLFIYSLWIEEVDLTDLPGDDVSVRVATATSGRENRRPETYDEAQLFRLLAAAAQQVGIAQGRIGIELEFAPAAHVTQIQSALPAATFANSSPLIRRLRLIKSAREIELIRTAVQITEQGIRGALVGLNESTLAHDIRQRYIEATAAYARSERILGFGGGRSTVHLGPLLWARTIPTRPAQRGDNVQFDSFVAVNEYKSDIGRTYVFGEPSDAQRRVEDALLAGFAAGLEKLKPGYRFDEVFAATEAAVRAAGFPSYARGHVGHSIGSDVDGEEWPWLSATETTIIEPGMVLAFEVPYYINGVGGFQNEDNLVITESGYESFNALPHGLQSVG